MQNRARQRANHRAKEYRKSFDKPWLNSEGYNDPTAFLAIRNMEKEEHRKRRSSVTRAITA